MASSLDPHTGCFGKVDAIGVRGLRQSDYEVNTVRCVRSVLQEDMMLPRAISRIRVQTDRREQNGFHGSPEQMQVILFLDQSKAD